jgi:branched-chain amino acid transport system permease protein
MNYIFHIMIMLGIYSIFIQSLNITMGYTGLVSLAQAAFYGIGAYTTTLLMLKLNINFFIALPIAVALTVILSFIVSIPSLRLKGDYFILATLGFQIIIFNLMYNWVSLTRGPYGIPGIPSPEIFGMKFDDPPKFFIISTIFALLVLYFFHLITSIKFGKILKAIREDEIATSTLGKNTTKFKIIAFSIGAGIASIAGSLFATYITYIDPTSFTLNESVLLVTILTIGGGGNIKGPLVGTLIITLLPEILRFLAIPDTIAPNIRVMLYALALILILIYKPQGLAGEYEPK